MHPYFTPTPPEVLEELAEAEETLARWDAEDREAAERGKARRADPFAAAVQNALRGHPDQRPDRRRASTGQRRDDDEITWPGLAAAVLWGALNGATRPLRRRR